MEMTPKELKRICRELQLYSTPELNDKIYLHYKGFRKIENLDEFIGLKVIYLEGNGLSKIEGLDKLTQLRCLYLQENQISVMENLNTLTDLDSLNLNQNLVKFVSGLSSLTKLNTLLLQGNKLSTTSNLEGLSECPSIGVLDLSKNKLEDGEEVLSLLARTLPNLKVLYLKDNPLVESLPNYRRKVISSLPVLTYLDERPVFIEERRTANAWARGGKAEEQLERQKIEQENQEKHTRNYQQFEKMLQDAREEQGAPIGAIQGGRIVEENTLPDEEDGSDDDNNEESKKEEKSNNLSEPPPLEDAQDSDAIIEHIVRPTSKITITHTTSATPATAPTAIAASSQPLLSLTPAAAAVAAIKPTPAAGSKKMLIEMVDDEEEKVPESNAAQVPDRGLIQQLD